MKLDLTKQYIDLETVNKFIEYNSDLSDVKPIPEPHLDVVFMSYNEKAADKHYELLKKRVPSAKRVNGVKGILNAYNACRELAETPFYFIVEGDSMICKDFKFKLPIEWLQSIASLDHNELNYDYVKARHCITWNSINPVNGEIGTHSPIGLAFKSDSLYNWKCDTNFNIPYNYINDIDSKESIKSIEADSFKCEGIRPNAIASVDFFNSSPYDAWKTGFRMGNRLTFRLLNLNSNLKETEERLNHWATVGEEQKNGKYCIEGVTYGIKCATICNNWIEEYRNTSDNYDWLKKTFEREYGIQYNTN